jgi:hypothetical protein
MFIMRIILLDENHRDGVIPGCKVEEIIKAIIQGERGEKYVLGTVSKLLKIFVGDGIPYELRPLFE